MLVKIESHYKEIALGFELDLADKRLSIIFLF